MSGTGGIWDYFQTVDPEVFRSAEGRLRFLARRTRRCAPGPRVLDVGVGDGRFARAALGMGLQVHVLDPSEGAIERLRAALGLGDRARVGRLSRVPFPDGSFDAVVVSEVLEHLDDGELQAGLDEIRRVLTDGGLLLGTVPAREVLRENLVVCPACGERFHRWGHKQSFSPEDVRALLTGRFDVKALEERHFFSPRAPTWRGGLLTAVRVALWRLGIRTSGMSIFFLARKPPGPPRTPPRRTARSAGGRARRRGSHRPSGGP